jgi:DNA (cytosine-5)-methyltransferase 1
MRAGINVIGGIDIDPNCKETYEEKNHSKFMNADASNKAQRLINLTFSQSIRVGIILPSLY